MPVNPSNAAWSGVNNATGKAVKKLGQAGKVVTDTVVPKTPVDVALTVFPYGKAARLVGGITGKGARAVVKLYRNVGR